MDVSQLSASTRFRKESNMDEGKKFCSHPHLESVVRSGQVWDVLYCEPRTQNPIGLNFTWLSRLLYIDPPQHL